MKNILFATIGFTFLSLIVDESKIIWEKEKPLKWEDFKGKHDANEELHAFTYTEIKLKSLVHSSPDSMKFCIECTFDRTKSSVMKGKETDSLLKHEQGHFDLGEIYARMMRKKIKATIFTQADLSKSMSMIYKLYFEMYEKEQDKYDTETNHSMDGEKQTLWNKNIQKRLDELDKYSNTIVASKIKK